MWNRTLINQSYLKFKNTKQEKSMPGTKQMCFEIFILLLLLTWADFVLGRGWFVGVGTWWLDLMTKSTFKRFFFCFDFCVGLFLSRGRNFLETRPCFWLYQIILRHKGHPYWMQICCVYFCFSVLGTVIVSVIFFCLVLFALYGWLPWLKMTFLW